VNKEKQIAQVKNAFNAFLFPFLFCLTFLFFFLFLCLLESHSHKKQPASITNYYNPT